MWIAFAEKRNGDDFGRSGLRNHHSHGLVTAFAMERRVAAINAARTSNM